ncbi:unnamed protein product [Paramecium primaurelia]|uniref:phosphatidylinositol 3-kinase n=2 Tax=Paramecium TaxID=5884 RepID=A0A8S1VW17_9CILI|nr:unnamed protein product [Paramecium primaurelia]CAD8181964.1 unnamed protein product [Paramecium pentaurelia]
MELQNYTNYTPHTWLQDVPVKLTISNLWDGNNVLDSLIDDPNKDEQLIIVASLYINGQLQYPTKTFKAFSRHSLQKQETIFFNSNIKDLSYNSLIALSIYSTQQKYEEAKPLGSTTFPLFDENLKLREGKINLLIWPNTQPDTSFNSKTPGLVKDRNIQDLNFCTRKIDEVSKGEQNDTNKNLSKQNLQIRLYYLSKIIPTAFLEVQLDQYFQQPILFEDYEYPQNDTEQQIIGGGYYKQPEDQIANQAKAPTQRIFIDQNQLSDTFRTSDFDQEFGKPDPIHDMMNLILRYSDHPETLKPQKDEEEKMRKMMARPLIGELKSDDKQLFVKYRYWAMQYGSALPFYLHSVAWQNQKEEQDALTIMKKWSPIDREDCLFLLSSFFCANEFKKSKKNKISMLEIRKYAVEQLSKLSDEKIENVLLQLVQALKYEPFDQKSDLVNLLFDRAIKSKSLATYLYWYLHVEKDGWHADSKNTILGFYYTTFQEFERMLQSKNEKLFKDIQGQSKFRQKLQSLATEIRSLKNDRQFRINYIKNQLSQSAYQNSSELPQHPCCLYPEYELIRAVPERTTIFSSAMAPIRLGFQVIKGDEESEIKLIFKNGDDLRQDQLVMQIFNLMDELLKGVSQDMKLLPYRILACSKSDGFLEFVPDNVTLQEIIIKKNQGMQPYLRQISEDKMNPYYWKTLSLKNNDQKDPENLKIIQDHIDQVVKRAQYGINPTFMTNYIYSSAGYCVLTYFLGIGDRHLENLLINNEGKMFHIDFGFILGKDPKPYPPPFKLCPEMVEAMGGQKSELYTLFKSKCVEVYVYLRRYAKLIINLFLLMADAGIKDYSQEAIEQMYEKFRLDDSDENAEIHFLGLLEESINSLFAKMTDKLHFWASYMRK